MSGTAAPWYIRQDDSGNFNLLAKQGPIEVCPAVAHGKAEAEQIARAINFDFTKLFDLLIEARAEGDSDALQEAIDLVATASCRSLDF